MDDDYLTLNYSGGVPGADTNSYVLFDSTTTAQITDRSQVRFNDYRRYILSLKNLQAGTLRASSSSNKGGVWQSFFELAVPPATAQRNNAIAIPVEPHADVKVEWINGGVAQGTFYVQQALDDGQTSIRAVFGDSSGSTATNFSSAQLPASLGQTTKAGSLSVVEASDGVQTKAASLRGYIRTEGLPITCGTVSKTFTVPAAWKGLYIRMQAEFSDVYYQISTAVGTPAVADKSARATETGGPPIALTAPASGNGCFRIPAGTFLDIPFPTNAETFALQANVDASVCRTHPAES